MTRLEREQRRICERFGARYEPPAPWSKLGIAFQTAGRQPLSALRHPAEGGACGWYIWWGDTLGESDEFFRPLHVEHISEYCAEILPYLGLAAGWRVQVAPGYEDVWYDQQLLSV